MDQKDLVSEKSGSFARREEESSLEGAATPPTAKSNDEANANTEGEEKNIDEENNNKNEENLPEAEDHRSVSEEIDRFVASLARKDGEDEVVLVEVPEFVNKFLDLIEGKVAKIESSEGKTNWGQALTEEDCFFLESVGRISNLNKSIVGLKLESNQSGNLINRVGIIQQRAMAFLEEEFRALLEESKAGESDPGGDNFKGKQESDRYPIPDSESAGDDVNFPGYSPDVISNMNRVAKEMIKGGSESECCEIYMIARRNALEESLHKLGFEKHSIDDVQKMHWEALEREIGPWIKTFKQCATVHFSGERNLAEAVFFDHPSIAASLFSNLTRGVVIQLLNFAEGIAMSKRSAEKLFKTLDMYETLRDMVPKMEGLFPDECGAELKTETTLARSRLGEAVICIFCDLENSIKSDTGKTPVPGGAVHPLTRYTMNYLKYACEYKDTLEQVFKQHSKIERADSTSRPQFESNNENDNNVENQSPFSVQLMRVMDLLDANLEGKSKLYKDIALSSIFMMNNGRYIVQKIKGSSEIYELMGDTWCRKRSSNLRNFHRNYQRETWSKLLGCLSHEGLSISNNKVAKPVLKERFKSFNAMFDEIHKTQSSWVVSDEQLQSELRVSISAVIIPAYRSFLGRFSQYLDPGRQTEKYIKFQPEDIETYIDELFDGNPVGTMKRKQ
ncbi:hypothetical protein UlMin_013858 [Ulmus minor]